MNHRLASPLVLLALLAPLAAWSQVSVSISLQPPPLPVYEQPPVPGEGYLWTPGYWAWNASGGDYFWVPGTWVLAPRPGYLWTPGYWGYYGSSYRWNVGYWGPSVGFYGGINYGHGYGGSGYQGGRWDRGAFRYNTSVTNVNPAVVHNVYNTHVVNNYNVPRASYNGGPHGVAARPTAAQQQERKGPHVAPLPNQVEHEHAAMAVPEQRASMNHGMPPQAATPRPAPGRAEPQPRPQSRPPAAHSQPAPREAAPQQAPHAPPQQMQRQQAQPQAEPQAQRQQGQPKPQAEARGQQRQNDEH